MLNGLNLYYIHHAFLNIPTIQRVFNLSCSSNLSHTSIQRSGLNSLPMGTSTCGREKLELNLQLPDCKKSTLPTESQSPQCKCTCKVIVKILRNNSEFKLFQFNGRCADRFLFLVQKKH